jgi:superfamily II DNA or RNA helicase
VRLLDQIGREIKGGCRRIVAQMATGGGKTICAATMAQEALATGKRVIVTVPALSLIGQTVEKFYAEGITDIGVIQANHPLTNYSRPIQIATAQTLQRREIPPADLVMIDECHRWFDFYGRWLHDPRWSEVPFIGLSATPWTRGLGRHFRKLIVGARTGELITAGYLSPFRVFVPSKPDLDDVRTVAGDYHEGDLSKVMNTSTLVADVVDEWRKRAQGRPTICFAVDRAHAAHLRRQFAEAGVNAAYVDAYTPVPEREEIARRFHTGKVEVVCNVGVLTTGIDWTCISCIILARPTKSEMLFCQMVGRGLRTAEGKTDCLILDHSDNHERLGTVDTIHHDQLDDGKPKPKVERRAEKLPKACPRCSFLKPPGTLTCPVCSFTPKPKCEVVAEDGELVELDSRRQQVQVTLAERRIFYAELRHIASDRGLKSGWAAHTFRAKFGAFPPWSWNNDITATPTLTTRNYVKSRSIAFAKARAGS